MPRTIFMCMRRVWEHREALVAPLDMKSFSLFDGAHCYSLPVVRICAHTPAAHICNPVSIAGTAKGLRNILER